MPDWYVFDEGDEKGPLPDDALIEYLRTKNPAVVFLWREGFDGWVLTRDVPDVMAALRPLPQLVAVRAPDIDGGFTDGREEPIAPPTRATRVSDGKERETSARYSNIIARHWRGELPLWVSYWVMGFFVGHVLSGLIRAFTTALFEPDRNFHPPSIFFAMTMTWMCAFGLLTWQVVGIWRSSAVYAAARHAAGKGAAWGAVARVAVVIGAVGISGLFIVEGIPQITETFRMAFQGDPTIPPYSIRVMRDGTEAEIVGGFKYGLTDDLEKALNASPRIKVVHLDSGGGRLGEGAKLFRLIHKRGLDTYVSSKCLSACTLAFVGGKRRYLLKGASLGFHRGAFPGAHEREFDDDQRAILRAAGVDSRFIDRALSTAHEDMWQPVAEVLLAAKVITDVADGTKFAISGVGTSFDKQKIAEALTLELPVFAALETRFPTQYSELIDAYHDSVLKSRTLEETTSILRAQLHRFVLNLLPMADDDVLVDYNSVLVDQYLEVNAKSSTACYLYASGADPNRNFAQEMSRDVIQRGKAIQERVVKTAVARAAPDKMMVESVWSKVRRQLVASGIAESELALLGSANLETPQHGRYCAALISLFREIGRLPHRETAILMREIFFAK